MIIVCFEIKVARYILKKPVVSQIKEIYLIIKDIVMYEKYTRQIGEKNMQFG